MRRVKKHGVPDPVFIANLPLHVSDNIAIAAGEVVGWSGLNKFGKSTDVDNSRTDLWDRANSTNAQPIWVAPTQARTHAIVSTSLTDSDSGGINPQSTGARTIRMFGLNAAGIEISEDVILDGTTSVNTANAYQRVYRMYVLTAGSNGANAGTITATATGDGTVTAQIQPSNNQTLMAIYTVPIDRTLYLTGYYAALNSAGGASALADVNLVSRSTGADSVFRTRHVLGIISTGSSYWHHEFEVPLVMSGLADIKVQAIGGTNLDVSGGFQGVLVYNE